MASGARRARALATWSIKRRRAGSSLIAMSAWASEALQFGERQQPLLDMHAAVLGAAVQRGDHLARVQRARRVEGRLDALHQRTLLLAELHAHRTELLDADAVLAGDGAAERDAQLQDLGAERLGALQLVAVV